MIDSIRQDVGYTLRLLSKHFVFTGAIVAVLALGIGGSTAIFSVVNNTLIRPMMLRDVDRLVRIDDRRVGGPGDETNTSPANTAALLTQQKSFSAIAVQDARTFLLSGTGEPQRLRGSGVSAGWNDALGVQPILGRAFTPSEIAAGGSTSAVLIGYGFWQRSMGGSRDVLNRTITLNGRPRSIIGVMPRGFRFPYEGEVWSPITYDEQDAANHYLLVFGRLREGVTIAQAQAELDAITAHSTVGSASTDRFVMRATSLRSNLIRGYDRTALALLAVVGFLLVLACVNVSGLLLVRMAVRRQEMIIRASLGATRARQITQLLTESTILSILGGIGGLAIAYASWPYLAMLVPPVMSIELAQNASALDMRVFAFTLSLATLAGIAVGVLPALRSTPANLGSALREGGRTGGTRLRGRTLPALVIAEVALAMALLVPAAGVVFGFRNNFGGRPGYNATGVLTMQVSVPEVRYRTAAERERLVASMLERVKAVPGVSSAAISTTNPRLTGWNAEIQAAERAAADAPIPVQYVATSGRLMDVLQIPLLSGRDLAPADRGDGLPVALVSSSVANRLWPGENAVGHRIRFAGSDVSLSVVGVVGDVRHAEAPFTDAIYAPYAQTLDPFITREFNLMVRTTLEPSEIARPVQRAIWQADADVPVFAVAALSDVDAPEYLLERTGASLGLAFGAFSVLLAAFGVFGILSFAASQGKRDNAIRITLGASPLKIGARVFSNGILLVMIGAVCGTLCGMALSTVLRSRLSNIAPIGAVGYVGLGALLILVAAFACMLPVRKVVAIDLVNTLRED